VERTFDAFAAFAAFAALAVFAALAAVAALARASPKRISRSQGQVTAVSIVTNRLNVHGFGLWGNARNGLNGDQCGQSTLATSLSPGMST
jgi:hypothetical protein